MHVAQRPPRRPTTSKPSAHPRWRLAAQVYTALGLICLLASAALPGDDVAVLASIAVGLPWSLGLVALELSPGVAQMALLILGAGWAVNAAVLWWLALRRPGTTTTD